MLTLILFLAAKYLIIEISLLNASGRGDKNQPINEIVLSGQLMGERTIRGTVDSDVSGSGSPIDIVDKLIAINGDSKVKEVDRTATDFHHSELNRGVQTIHKRQEHVFVSLSYIKSGIFSK